MKERYNVLKKFYMGYLICFVKKGKYYFYGDDKLIGLQSLEEINNFMKKAE